MHHSTQPILIFNRENPQNFPNDLRRGLGYIVLKRADSGGILELEKLTITVFPHIVSAETILFLDLKIQRSQYIWPKVTHKCAETIQGGKLFRAGNYMRKYGI